MPSSPDDPLIPALATPAFAHQTAPETNILIGPLGLRAGWGILLYAMVSLLLALMLIFSLFKAAGRSSEYESIARQSRAAATEASRTHSPAAPQLLPLSFSLLSEIAQCSAVLLAGLGLSFLERRRFAVYGLPSTRMNDLLRGALAGLMAICLLIGLLRGFHLLYFDRRLLFGAAALRFGLEWLLVFLLVGLFEEFFFRGYVQFTLMRGLLGFGRRLSPGHARVTAFWISAVLLSLLFFIAHIGNAGENPGGLAGVFLAGLLFSYALWRTGSLWWGIGAHMTWDWAQSFLFGVPDSGALSIGRLFQTHPVGNPLLSGGMDGPEGSLLIMPSLFLLALAVRLHPRGEQPQVEPESLPPVPHRATPEPIA